ncbi:hypothetical protein BDY19DRAFT_956087 [Irpex rosettiformis]|uniref:Uncharacterized protein n=1 Tax=Irpex rosettiformis TaxID=378272 RepID=A0ACB8TYN7_9APHY|nr:hypothetical protein BDY19DRAFT_956087 [Irpex rosettiformis]
MTEGLSVEIWSQIFFEACVDGGCTACALSEVSRYFRDAVLSVQLDNVVLIGQSRMIHFAALLRKREGNPCHRCVRHLFLSNSGQPSKTPYVDKDAYATATGYVLSMVSPNLVTLTSTLPLGKVGKDNILHFPFPKLRELTVHCPIIDTPPDRKEGPKPSLPSLRYLHILSTGGNSYIYTQHAPVLTHLRLSTLASVSLQLYEAISFAVRPGKQNTDGASSKSLLPPSPFKLSPTVTKILVHFSPSRLAFRNGSFLINGDPMNNALQELDGGEKLVFLDSGRGMTSSDFLAQGTERKDWEERMVGKLGCWAEPP